MRTRFARPLGSDEAADFLRIPLSKLYEMTWAGTLPHKRVVDTLYYSRADLEGFLGLRSVEDDGCPVVTGKAVLTRKSDGKRVDALFNATPRLWFLSLEMIGRLRRNRSLRISLWNGADDFELPGFVCDNVTIKSSELNTYVKWRRRHDDDYTQLGRWMPVWRE